MGLAFGCCAAALTCLAGDAIVTTQRQVSVGGRPLAITARAGLLPIRDNEAGEVHGSMFFVAYSVAPLPGAPARPLTFLWNGGPGSNSGLVHLLGFGPRRIVAATGAMPRFSPNGTALVDNQDTWLTFTDLVFVDPIGTGYSRPAKPEYASEFYQGRGDAESVAEFIRVFRTHFDTFDQPLYLLGESYGVTRCALVAEALERRRTSVAGVVMLSGGFPLAEPDPIGQAAFYLPTLTAAAHYNKRLPPELQSLDSKAARKAAEDYAKGAYAAALARAGTLSDAEREAVVAQLARFTGLPAREIDRAKLAVTMDQFANGLLAAQNLAVGHYDSRMVGPRDPSPQYDPTKDPSLKDILDNVSVLRYLRRELGFESDLLYQGPFGGGYPPATEFRGDWMSVKWGRNGAFGPTAPSAVKAFRAAMAANPHMKALIVTGHFDLVFSYFANEQAALALPADLEPRVSVRSYSGGHALYTDDAVRKQLRLDAVQFYRTGGGN